MTNQGARGTAAGGALHAPRGVALSCKGWEQEAALRMLMNCADAEVAEAERPEEDLGYGAATGGASVSAENATRDDGGCGATVAALRELEGDQTLLVRAGLVAGAFRTSATAPRVLIAATGSDDINHAAAASWLYVGTQTGLPAAHEAFAAATREHFGGTLAGRLVMAGGMGATGGALPLAATLNGAAFLGVEADPEQIKRRVKSGYCEAMVNDLDEALRILKNSVRRREAASVGLIGNCAEVIPELARRGIVPDLLIDCTSACGSLDHYVPSGLTTEQSRELRRADPDGHRQRSIDSLSAQIPGILELKRLGSLVFQFSRGAERGGGASGDAGQRVLRNLAEIPDFSAEYIEPLGAKGRALLLWAALSGEPVDIARADRLALDVFSADEAAGRWIRLAGKHVQFQGLPARVCLVDRALRARFGLALNDLVAQGALKAPMVIGCDDTTAPRTMGAEKLTGASAVEALIGGLGARASAASWVCIDDGARPSMRGSRLPMFGIVADGTAEMARRIEGVLSDGFGADGARTPDARGTGAAR